ncbi:MAG: hypothetical protein ACOYVK_04855 [Bacillota bacterium]
MRYDKQDMKLEEEIMVFMSQPQFREEIEEAKNIFYGNSDEAQREEEITLDFNSWLMYDFKDKKHQSFFEKYYLSMSASLKHEEKDIFLKRLRAYPSLYEIKEKKENRIVLTDVFSKAEKSIKGRIAESIEDGELIMARLYPHENGFGILGNMMSIPKVFKSSIERNMINKYQEFQSKNLYATWEDFLRENSILLYRYIGVIGNVLMHQDADEDIYKVWLSTYLIRDFKKVKAHLLNHKSIQMDYEEQGLSVLKLHMNRKILAEIELTSTTLEIESNCEKDRKKSKALLEEFLGDMIVHYKDEVLGIDEIL